MFISELKHCRYYIPSELTGSNEAGQTMLIDHRVYCVVFILYTLSLVKEHYPDIMTFVIEKVVTSNI